MSSSSPKSAELFRQAQEVLAGGVSRNTLLRSPHPLYAAHASGCRITDVDGVERIDFANNMASLIHGHAHPAIVEALTEQAGRGTAFTMATEVEVAFARHLCTRSEGFERVRFMNSGTEAVMAAIKASRAFTGRPRFAKVEGTYHGAYDFAEVSQEPDPRNWGERGHPASVALAKGTPEGVLQDVVILPFNAPEGAVAVLDEHKDDLACVLLDLMPHRVGLLEADEAFVRAIYDWTRANGALLVFDEVITFRTEFGGMQERYGIHGDLTALGKIIGGGLPAGAVAGRAEVMDVFSTAGGGARLPQSGTFSANPMTMTAGRVAMELFTAEEVARLNRLGSLARGRIGEAILVSGVPACVTGTGSLFRIHLGAEAPTDYRSSFMTPEQKAAHGKFINALYDEGVMMVYSGMGVLATPMGEEEIDRLAEAVLNGLRKIA